MPSGPPAATIAVAGGAEAGGAVAAGAEAAGVGGAAGGIGAAGRRRDWSNQELADLYRTQRLLAAAGIAVDVDRGLTDEGDPWFVYCDTRGQVVIHLARIRGLYVLDGLALGAPLHGADFDALIAAFSRQVLPDPAATGSAEAPARIVQLHRRERVYLHPAMQLAALIWTIYLATHDGPAADIAADIATDGPSDGLLRDPALQAAWQQPDPDGHQAGSLQTGSIETGWPEDEHGPASTLSTIEESFAQALRLITDAGPGHFRPDPPDAARSGHATDQKPGQLSGQHSGQQPDQPHDEHAAAGVSPHGTQKQSFAAYLMASLGSIAAVYGVMHFADIAGFAPETPTAEPSTADDGAGSPGDLLAAADLMPAAQIWNGQIWNGQIWNGPVWHGEGVGWSGRDWLQDPTREGSDAAPADRQAATGPQAGDSNNRAAGAAGLGAEIGAGLAEALGGHITWTTLGSGLAAGYLAGFDGFAGTAGTSGAAPDAPPEPFAEHFSARFAGLLPALALTGSAAASIPAGVAVTASVLVTSGTSAVLAASGLGASDLGASDLATKEAAADEANEAAAAEATRTASDPHHQAGPFGTGLFGTGLAGTGLAGTGLAGTGLANTGLIATGSSLGANAGVAAASGFAGLFFAAAENDGPTLFQTFPATRGMPSLRLTLAGSDPFETVVTRFGADANRPDADAVPGLGGDGTGAQVFVSSGFFALDGGAQIRVAADLTLIATGALAGTAATLPEPDLFRPDAAVADFAATAAPGAADLHGAAGLAGGAGVAGGAGLSGGADLLPVPTLAALPDAEPAKPAFSRYDDTARGLVEMMVRQNSFATILMEHEIILIDRSTITDQTADVYARSWTMDDGSVVSLIGVRADFEAFHLAA